MSTPVLNRPAPTGHSAALDGTATRVTLPRIVNSEWIKFRTLRSSWLMLGGAVLAMVALGLIIGYNTGKNWTGLQPEDAAPSSVLQGFFLGQLLMGVLGVLFVTGEYGTGMIRSTLAAVPRRVPVVVAKSIVFGVLALVAMVPAAFGAFFAGQAFLSHYGHGTSLTDPGVLRVVLGTGIYLALVGLLGSAIGWIVRSTAGGISVYVGIVLVLPLLAGLLPGKLGKDVVEYLPSTAGQSFSTSVHTSGTLSPWPGLAVLVAWVVAALVLAAVLLRRRDA